LALSQIYLLPHLEFWTYFFTGDSFDFFEELQLVLELGNPLSDAIHQLEADRPLLSQLFSVFEALVSKTKEWMLKVKKVSGCPRGFKIAIA